MAVTFQDLKRWSGKKGFDIGKFGESKAELIKKLVKYMKDNLDDLTEEQLGWYEEQTGGEVKPKKKSKKEKKKPEPKTKKKKEKVEEEEEVEEKEEKPKRKKKKKEPEEEGVIVQAGSAALKDFAKELGISTKGHKKWEQHEWEELANKIYAEVDDMDDDDREELSKDLFAFYTTIKGQQETSEPEVEETPDVEVPKKIQIKRWSNILGIKVKGKEPEEIAQEILREFKELDDDDKKELPESLVKWANAQFGVEEEEEEVVEEMVLPDYKTLKSFAKEVGFKLKDIKKADKHPPTLVEMIMEAYDTDDEDEYSEELVAFVEGMAPVEEVKEPEDVEPDTGELVGFLVEAGYDEDDIDEWTYDQLVAKLVEDYKDKDDREDLPEEAIDFLKDTHPELFKKKKKVKK